MKHKSMLMLFPNVVAFVFFVGFLGQENFHVNLELWPQTADSKGIMIWMIFLWLSLVDNPHVLLTLSMNIKEKLSARNYFICFSIFFLSALIGFLALKITLLGEVFLSTFILYSIYHNIEQHRGIAQIYFPSNTFPKVLYRLLLILPILVYLFSSGFSTDSYLPSIQPLFPQWLIPAFYIGALVCWALILATYIFLTQKRTSKNTILFTLFTPLMFFLTFYFPRTAIAFIPIISVAHGIQYIYFSHEWDKFNYNTSSLRFIYQFILITLVSFVILRGPALPSASKNLLEFFGIENDNFLVLMQIIIFFSLSINMMHYYLDSVIWKSSKSDVVNRFIKTTFVQ